MTFAALGLPERIHRGVRAAGFTQPTPIQSRAIPLIVPGHDLIAAAQTGSGKTLAFLLPILGRLLDRPRALRALVLVPTRELAGQIEDVGKDFSRFTDINVGAVFGGVPIGPQESMLRNQGVDLLVATPGRLLDLHGRQSLALEDIEVLVLDEADRMVDMGFAPDLQRILRLLPEDRQTLMFSATMPRELNAVASEALYNPKRIELAPPSRPAPAIVQRFYPVQSHVKLDLLDHLLTESKARRAIVFARTRRGADKLARGLHSRGHVVAVLHGDRSQSQRERALLAFKRGRAHILIATDIASRGIDVDRVTHVINFDVPRTPDDYVHRIGRTGRMDAHGEAITLMSPNETEEVTAIERALGHKVERVTVEGFHYHRRDPNEGRAREPRGDRGGRGATRDRASQGGGRSHSRPHEPSRNGAHESRHSGSHGSSHSKPHGSTPSEASGNGADQPVHGRRRRLNVTDRRSRRRM